MELINTQYLDSVFADIVKASFEQLIETGEAIIKVKKNTEKGFGVFALLDIWNALTSSQETIKQVIKCENAPKYEEELGELINGFSFAAKKSFEEFEDYVKNDTIKQIPPDGTVHELTSNVCVFFKRIIDYKDSVLDLWGVKPSATPRTKQNALGDFMGNDNTTNPA